MKAKNLSATVVPENEIVLTRLIDAPRELVFKQWTEPERMKRWWGPKGFTMPYCKIELRPGGVCHSCMRSPEGRDFWSKSVYREIVEPERLVLTDSFSDERGNVIRPEQYGMSPDWPLEALITVTLTEEVGKTLLTVRHSGLASAPARDVEMCREGWSQTLDKLVAECK